MVNGKTYDWEDIKFYLDGVPITDIREISYTDSVEHTNIYAGGNKPIGLGRGNMEGSGDLTLGRDAYQTLINIARAAGKSIYDYKPGTIVVVYGAKKVPDEGDFVEVSENPLTTDTLYNAVFKKRDMSARQNDTGLGVKLEFTFEPPIR